MVTAHVAIVRIILSKMRHRLPINADMEELHGAGIVGLVEAARKFDPSRGYSFDTFAAFRVRGAIQDALRSLDCLSRGARRKCKELAKVEASLAQSLGREATDAEVRLNFKLDVKAFRKLRSATATWLQCLWNRPILQTKALYTI